MDCSLSGSSVHGIFPARILEWIPSHFLLQGIFPTQELNLCLLCLLHCWQILYLLSHWGSSSQYYNLFTQIPIVFPIMNRVIEIFFSCYYDILSYLNSQYCNFIVIIYPKGLSIHDQSLCIQKSGQLLEDFTFESLTLNLVMLLFGSVFKRLL